MQGLYIHIPFCIKKCNYCDFISFSGQEEKMETYVAALLNELKNVALNAADKNIDTVFIGGGTPSYLDSSLIIKIMETVSSLFVLSKDAEITMEANPKTFTEKKLLDYRKAGINRLSIGLQSVNDKSLKILGRVHNFDDFKKSYYMARDFEFDNINIDLIYCIPNETKEMFFNTIDNVLILDPEHISLYSLIIEEGTPFYELNQKGLLDLPSEEDEINMISYAKKAFIKKGYERYEISNYSKPGKKCRHNLNYWYNGFYFAAGLAAHSCLKDNEKIIRQKNVNSLSSYINGCFEYEKEFIIKKDSMFETVMLGLRLIEGFSLKAFRERYGESFLNVYEKPIEKLINEGLLEIENDMAFLTDRGLDIQNTVLLEFLKE